MNFENEEKMGPEVVEDVVAEPASDVDPSTIIASWDELDIPITLLRGIYGMGFEKPSPIQQKAIKPMLSGRDLIAQAQSGTGKTGTFSIGAMATVDLKDTNALQVLILSPTRELATQTTDVIEKMGILMKGLVVQTMIGGNIIEEDMRKLKATPPQIISGCPGRVFDMVRRKHINFNKLKLFILDEADEMLSKGFGEQVKSIFQFFERDVQIALFSATLPEGITEITDMFMKSPNRISVKREQLTLEGISQYFVATTGDNEKYEVIKDIYGGLALNQTIIYCNSVKRVQDLYDAMIKDGFPVCCIHSEMDKGERAASFNSFKSGEHRVLISTDVTSRGIDIQTVSAVINFDITKDVQTYLHRIGRSGRWGRKGVAINFITRRDGPKLQEIEEHYHTQISELPGDYASLL
jgi:superfamily II DNA/RNA helicase